MTKIENPPTKEKAPSLDQKIVDTIGRIPYSMIFGIGVAIVVELMIVVRSYLTDDTEYFLMLDNINRYIYSYYVNVSFFGTFGGLAVGLMTCLATMRIPNKYLRAVIGIFVGLFARYLAEIITRTLTEGALIHGWDYARFFMHNLIPAGMIEGFIIGLLPLSKKKF